MNDDEAKWVFIAIVLICLVLGGVTIIWETFFT